MFWENHSFSGIQVQHHIRVIKKITFFSQWLEPSLNIRFILVLVSTIFILFQHMVIFIGYNNSCIAFVELVWVYVNINLSIELWQICIDKFNIHLSVTTTSYSIIYKKYKYRILSLKHLTILLFLCESN